PVEIPIGGLYEGGSGRIAVRLVEAVQRCHFAAGGDLEDGAIAVGPAGLRCPVEGPIGRLDQPRLGVFAVRAIATALRAKAIKSGQRASQGDSEDRAIVVGSARV